MPTGKVGLVWGKSVSEMKTAFLYEMEAILCEIKMRCYPIVQLERCVVLLLYVRTGKVWSSQVELDWLGWVDCLSDCRINQTKVPKPGWFSSEAKCRRALG